jgi:SAM-dependent methyltransferase
MISSVRKKVAFATAMGPAFVAHEVKVRLRGEQQVASFRSDLFNGNGLEIGGPSGIFRGDNILPVYEIANRIDNVTFASETRWEGTVGEGATFAFNPSRNAGTQFILDGSDLSSLPKETYDFILSSHMLEHSANPLKALHSWKEILRPSGTLLLVLPHRDSSFDHRRPVTKLAHLVSDFLENRSEDDQTHFEEILNLHDLRRDPGQQSAGDLEKWICANSTNRGAHHHVFDLRLVIEVLTEAGFQVDAAESVLPMHIIVTAVKPHETETISNNRFLSPGSARYQNSPFASDRNVQFQM